MASKIKSLQLWCKRQCEGYRDVEVTNMTSSWKSGLAFCAIIHRYRPDLIDYDSLLKENVFENNKLAFDVGQEQLNIPALLDPEDMVTMTVPDKLCIVTYVSQYYNTFCKMEAVGGPGVKQCRTPAKRTLSASHTTSAPASKKITPTKPFSSDHKDQVTNGTQASQNGHQGAAPARRSTYGDTCHICGRKVYLMERHIEDSKLYHRRCIRDKQKSLRSPTRSQHAPRAFQYPCDTAASIPRQNAMHTAESSKENKLSTTHFKSANLNGHAPAGPSNKLSEISSSVKSSEPATNASWRQTSSENGSASLVKMLHGSPAPYGSSAPSNTQKQSTSDHNKPTVAGNILRPVPKDRNFSAANRANKQNSEAPSIRQRAAMFNDGPTGEQRAISHGTKPATSVTKPSTFSQVKPQVDTMTYTYHAGVVSSVTHPSASDRPAPVSLHSGLLQSLAHIRRQKSQEDDAVPPAGSTAKGDVHGDKVKAKEEPNDQANKSFLGYKSALNSDDSSKVDSSKVSTETPGVSSILRSRVTEGPSPQSADSTSQKSILKQSSPRNSFDATAQKDSNPKTILRPRFSDELDPKGADDHPRTILKSRKSSDEFEPVFGSPGNPRPILKSMVSPPGSVRSRSTSPPKSILKSRESSPDAGHKPAKSILKGRDSVEDMEVDDSLLVSILKHSQEDSSVTRDDSVTPPSRSILKRTPPHEQSPSRSILRGGTASSDQDIHSKKHQTPPERGGQTPAEPHRGDAVRPSCETLTPSPRAQIKISAKTPTPQPAPRHHKDKTPMSHKPKPERPEQPTSWGKYQSPAKTDPVARMQPYNRGRPTSPKSILKTHHEISKPSSQKSGSSPTMSRKVQGKAVPQVGISAGVPSVSASASKSSAGGVSSQPYTAVNNFSAFNLNDSLFIHGKTDPSANDTTSKAGSKTENSPLKSTWHMEVDARKGLHQPDVKPKISSRPLNRAEPEKRTPHNVKPCADTPADGERSNKPSWQLEAEKRQTARKGKYEDPEFRRVNNARKKTLPSATGEKANELPVTRIKTDKPSMVGDPVSSSFGKFHEQFKPSGVDTCDKPLSPPPRPPPPRIAPPPPPPTPPSPQTLPSKTTEQTAPPIPRRPDSKHQYEKIWESPSTGSESPGSPTNSKAVLNRSPAFRITDSPQSSPESNRSQTSVYSEMTDIPQMQPTDPPPKRLILPDAEFTFNSGDFQFNLNEPGLHSGFSPPHSPMSADADVVPPGGDWIQRRPLPTPPHHDASPHKRFINAESRVGTLKIVRELDDLDQKLRCLEEEGRVLEEKIRAVSEDDMDEGALMCEWFEMISNKNNLVRKESELMYRQRQQELEDMHMDLEYELRLLMQKPEHERTASERVRENTLIQELLETVNLRNHIVDSMEEDRIRYIAEDQEIADVMAGMTNSGGSGGKKKKNIKKQLKKIDKVTRESPERKTKDDYHLRKKGAGKDRKAFRLTIG